MSINSRAKGKRIELMARDFGTSMGFTCRRGQQYAGGPDSPDVIFEELPDVHIEVKGDRRIRLGNKPWHDAQTQAMEDCGDKTPVVLWWAHRGVGEPAGFRLTVVGTGATYVSPSAIARVLRGLQSQADVDREIKKATGDTQ